MFLQEFYTRSVLFQLIIAAQEAISRTIGLPYEALIRMRPDSERKLVEKKFGHPLDISRSNDSRRIGRGNPYLTLNRIVTSEEIDQKVDSIKRSSKNLKPVFNE